MKKERDNDGYCFINGRTKPQYMLSALHNIPYELLPSSLKNTEDLLVNIGIKPAKGFAPKLNKIEDDLKKSSKSMEDISKRSGVDYMFRGTIPYVKEYSRCDYGQDSIDTVKNLNIREFYLGLEDGMYSLSRYLKNIKHLLNNAGKEMLEERFENQYGDKQNRIERIASSLYNNAHEVEQTEEIKKIRRNLDMIKETLGSEASWDEWAKMKPKIKQLQKKAKEDFKKAIHNYWLEDWYEEFAWDFDKEERKALKNPYK